jgi:methyl-accepting chemotaxis protein
MMPNTIGKTTLHEETSDAGGEMARTIRETEASRKSVRDAAEASREASRGDEAIGETVERASEAVARIVSEAADASPERVNDNETAGVID